MDRHSVFTVGEVQCVSYFHSNDVWACVLDKKLPGKSKDEQMAEKKQELEKRLQDVTGQLGSAKKPPKKGDISGD